MKFHLALFTLASACLYATQAFAADLNLIPNIPGFTIWDNASKTLTATNQAVPFSFSYGGVPFNPATWKTIPESPTAWRYIDPSGVIELRVVLTPYEAINALKWRMAFRNISPTRISAPISKVKAANIQLISSSGFTQRYAINYHTGALGDAPASDGSAVAPVSMPDFTPIRNSPPKLVTVRLASVNGRSSSGVLPYFNIELPGGGGGVIFAVGWSGQWEANFAVDGTGTNLRYTAGQQHFYAQLRPGEMLDMPSSLLMTWTGPDRFAGYNKFRRAMLQYFTPRDAQGNLPRPIAAAAYANGNPETVTAEALKKAISAVAASGLPLNTFWQDAGWYPVVTPQQDPNLFNSLVNMLWVSGVGDWNTDPIRFPNGYGEISDRAHAKGMKSLLWFEPERVAVPAANWTLFRQQSRLLQSHYTSAEDIKKFGTYNFGDGNNVRLMFDIINARIRNYRLDIYRQDMNGDGPLADWLLNDRNQSRAMGGIARTGFSEAAHVAGVYRFWDMLRAANPGLLIDNCASGGRRLDFESMSRSLPLWRSDRVWDPVEQQNEVLGLSMWLPLHGRGSDSGTSSADPLSELKYKLRSGYGWNGIFAFPWGTSIPERVLSLLGKELGKLYGSDSPFGPGLPLAEIFKGDYYPMDYDQVVPPIGNWAGSMPSWVNKSIWVGWEFFRADLQKGLVQAFRRSPAAPQNYVFKLKGLSATSVYQVTQLDSGAQYRALGSVLMGSGITAQCGSPAEPHCTAVFAFERVQ